jgi:hypothetical protein
MDTVHREDRVIPYSLVLFKFIEANNAIWVALELRFLESNIRQILNSIFAESSISRLTDETIHSKMQILASYRMKRSIITANLTLSSISLNSPPG